MVGKRKKEPLCGDTFNSLAKIDKEFHWSKAYSWYSNSSADDKYSNHLKTTSLVKARCMLEIFNVPKLALRCSKNFDATKRLICLGESTMPPIILSLIIFQKMLRLSKPNKKLKLIAANLFISTMAGQRSFSHILQIHHRE